MSDYAPIPSAPTDVDGLGESLLPMSDRGGSAADSFVRRAIFPPHENAPNQAKSACASPRVKGASLLEYNTPLVVGDNETCLRACLIRVAYPFPRVLEILTQPRPTSVANSAANSFSW